MSAFDEQNEEMEVLDSIYPSELTVLSTNPHKFKLLLCPNPGGEDNHVSVSLVCEFPADYPTNTPPIINIEVVKGLSIDRGEELKSIADKVASENVGLPSIFTVAESVKEWLIDNNLPGQDGSMYSDMMRRMQQKEVDAKKQTDKAAHKALADNEFKDLAIDPEELERIRKRQAGTQVTLESFMKWKVAFDEEMRLKAEAAAAAALKASGGSAVVINESRLSGKQLFLQNKATADDAEVEALITAGESEEIVGIEGGGEEEDDEEDEDYVEGEEGDEEEGDDEDD